ncbi:hypothetical protein HUJ05_002595 [Dendroctonus ponderosae]|nr:hypothetical protein HUJ05_002595 [Dendroctonus ponderosae]
MSDLRKTLLGLPHKRSSASSLALSKQQFLPLKWQDYFDKEEYIDTVSGRHHVYIKGCKGPIILCLHGGGYNGLTWSLFARERERKKKVSVERVFRAVVCKARRIVLFVQDFTV